MRWDRVAGPTFLALRRGEPAKGIETLIAAHADKLHLPILSETLMHAAASGNRVAELEALARAGIAVDICDQHGNTSPLDLAAGHGCQDAVAWLLEHGANIEGLGSAPHCTPLISAVMNGHIVVVRLLLRHGANVNAWYELQSGSHSTTMNALKWALANGHNEITELLRLNGGTLPKEADQPQSMGVTFVDQVLSYLESKFGKVNPTAIVEIVPSDLPISVNVFRDTPKGNVLATTGMSVRPMVANSADTEDFSRAEMLLHLPKDWPLDADSVKGRIHGWPVNWLRMIARFPHAQATNLGRAVVVTRAEIPELLAPGTDFEAALVARNIDDYGQFIANDGLIVSFYDVLPLFREEAATARSKGVEILVDQLDTAGVSEAVIRNRANAARVE